MHIGEANLQIEAKIDTGVDTTSVNAEILRTFSVGNGDWIQFKPGDKQGHTVELKRKVERYVNIKRKRMPPDRRPVVQLGDALVTSIVKSKSILLNARTSNIQC